ncbi:nuclear transport factor 2 family protein [Nocardioides marmorisolisilvae]|uniref:Nuclear transport factor 2 family protein n=1 Tax=Nocardioides marmorisolisilvae TaxID=1542737 RepID=A0A3N0DWB9_9ACTN|nr:nuclear transport factor 2 family protein [Nocardioides marmorisolisilvae]RNL79912.1 nuclear transport factor 2 family protein [Nocardioides marmorisolisilvae]
MDLASIEEIRQLKYRYFRTLDMKEWDEFGDCLAEDVVARYGTQAMDKPLHFDNRKDVVEFMSGNLGTSIISIHIASHPEIAVDGDTATGSWGFEDTVIVPDFKVMIRGGGYYKDEYRKDADGRWRISATKYERIYEAMTSLEDTPSFKLIANRWDPDLAH